MSMFSRSIGAALFFLFLLLPTSLLAQGFESLQLRPSVMIVVDSSGSMDSNTAGNKIVCAGGRNSDGNPNSPNSCTTYDTGTLPSAANLALWGAEKSRYILAREALSGTYDPEKYFCCFRNSSPDTPNSMTQLEDGIMDMNSGTAKFGMATFDTSDSVSTTSTGMFSYGDETGVNVGIKNESATSGRLVSVGSSDSAADLLATNTLIQTVIESSLPNGRTPTGPALYDLGYYYKFHPDNAGDPYKDCRSKNIIMLTDGAPTTYSSYNTPPVQAALLLANQGIKTYVVGFNTDSDTGADANMRELAMAGGTCDDLADPFCYYVAQNGSDLKFVVNVILADILGGKGARTKTATTTRTSFRDDHVGMYEVSASFEIVPGSAFWKGHLERVTYECNSSGELVPQANPLDYAAMLEGTAGVDRRIFTTVADPSLVPRPTNPEQGLGMVSIKDPTAGNDDGGADGDPFDNVCDNGEADKDLELVDMGAYKYYRFVGRDYELKPYQCTLDTDCAGTDQFCYFGRCHIKQNACVEAGDCCDGTDLSKRGACKKTCFRGYCSAIQFQKTYPECLRHSECTSDAFPVCHLGKCVQGIVTECSAGELLPERGLGDILHSNPALVGGPELDLPFPGYQAFRRLYGQRDTMLYVGGNDGMLHGFLTGGLTSAPEDEGKEVFAFIPKEIHSKLKTALKGRMTLFDGSPLIKDVRLYRDGTKTPSEKWATVLVSGLRGGGHSYFALDVTDPLRYSTVDDETAPTGDTILWEITQESPGFEDLGLTFAQAAIGSVYFFDGTTSSERAVAILSGGVPDASPSVNEGAAIYVVDLETGALLRTFTTLADGTTPLVPVTGTPAAFNSKLGSVLSRAFVGDQLGRLLRIDLAGGDPDLWSVEVFYDPTGQFDPADVDYIEPIYYPPAISLNKSSQLVVVFGNGDIDNLEVHTHNGAYVASVSEVLELQIDGSIAVVAEENWFSNFASSGEKLTGDPVIFNKVAYFPTFVPGNASCDLGHARIYGVHYKDNDGGSFKAVHDLRIDANIDSDTYVDFGGTTVVFGVAVASRPACVQTTADSSGVVHYAHSTRNEPQLIVQTGANPFNDMVNPPETTGTAAANEVANKVRIDLPKPPSALKVLSWSAIYE